MSFHYLFHYLFFSLCFLLSRLTEKDVYPSVSSFEFLRMLYNLTALHISNAGGQNCKSVFISTVFLLSMMLCVNSSINFPKTVNNIKKKLVHKEVSLFSSEFSHGILKVNLLELTNYVQQTMNNPQ